MKKNQPSSAPSSKDDSSENQQLIDKKSREEPISQFRDQIKNSLEELDSLLAKLQNDNVPVENLRDYYMKGKAYLEHCESLLQVIEQDVIDLDLDRLD